MFDIASFQRRTKAGWADLWKRVQTLRHQPDRRIRDARRLVEGSPFFDRAWYLLTYPDVASSGVDALEHYLTLGWREARDPGPMFTTSAYLQAYDDVAKSGLNPLVHFIEFGLSEGRDSFGDHHSPPVPSLAADSFRKAHECVSLPRPRPRTKTWCSAENLNQLKSSYVAVGAVGAGYTRDQLTRERVISAGKSLRTISGFADSKPLFLQEKSVTAVNWLVDAWYVNTAQLRTRWNDAYGPFVVRAFQCDPRNDGEVSLVGEGLVVSSLDFVDVKFRNPYFPLLFIFTDQQGFVISTSMLVFPSLCRGGLHYPELLWLSANATGMDVHAVSEDLAAKLSALRHHQAHATVTEVKLALEEADGTFPFLCSDFLIWLSRVHGLDALQQESTTPCAGARSSRIHTFKRTLGSLGEAGLTLVIPPDAAPTIASLTEHHPDTMQRRHASRAALLVARLDPSAPTLYVDIPAAGDQSLNNAPSKFPRLVPSPKEGIRDYFPIGAVRVSSNRQLADAELLLPAPGDDIFTDHTRVAMTWLLDIDECEPQEILQLVSTISLQRSHPEDAIALIGEASSILLPSVEAAFCRKTTAFRNQADAIEALQTPLTTVVSGGILLHDARVADCFRWMLSNQNVATASCVLVLAERRAGLLKSMIVDGGAFLDGDGRAAKRSDCSQAATELWRSYYPVLTPSPRLWATSSVRLRSWLSRSASTDKREKTIHLCSSLVTASCVSEKTSVRLPSGVPAAINTAASVGWLAG